MIKRTAYVLFAGMDNGFAAGNIALGINKYMPAGGHAILIYYDSLSVISAHTLEKIENVKLMRFTPPSEYENRFGGAPRPKAFADGMPFCRYEVFGALNDYEIAIWIDASCAIQASPIGLEGFAPLGMAFDMNDTGGRALHEYFPHPIAGFDLERRGYSSNIIVAGRELEKHGEMREWLWEKTAQFNGSGIDFATGLINLAIQHFGISVTAVNSDEYMASPYSKSANAAKVVFFGCKRAIWKNSNLLKAFPEWLRTHLEWLRLGGDDFERKGIDDANILSAERESADGGAEEMIMIRFCGIKIMRIDMTKAWWVFYLFCRIPIIKILKSQ